MKSSAKLFGILFVSLGTAHGAEPTLVKFDEFALGTGFTGIPGGYGGLQWENFGAYNGAIRPATEGYRTGTISSPNVAFNLSGDPAAIRSDVPFDLGSAYLTAAFVNDLQVEVQGWTGTTLAYHNTYTLNPAGPTLAQFNYIGVDQVRFIATPSSQFIVDDLTVTVPGSSVHKEPCRFTLSPGSLAHGAGAETGTVSVATQEGCAWAVLNANTWVTVLSSLNNSNSGSVTYRVAANPRAIGRSGTINIAGHSFGVSQAPGQVLETHTPVELGTVRVSTIGYSLLNPPRPPHPGFPPMSSSVAEYLIDQDQNSGGGGVLPNITANWDTNIQYTLTVSAPAGQRFLVQVPEGQSARFGGFLLWESSRGGSSPVGPVTVRFNGLEGTPPDFAGSDAVLSDSHGYFGFWEIISSAFSSDLSFSSVTFTGTVTPQYMGFESLNFVPHHESSLQIVHPASDINGSGRFVSIVPESAPPRIQVVALSPNTGAMLMVEGQSQRTNVVEASADLVRWTPISTNVMPATVCPTCPFVYVQDTAVTNPGRRFYRVFEIR